MTTLRRPLLALVPALLLLACGAEDRSVDGRGTYERGVGKADGSASCEGVCGGQAAGGCWCDDTCLAFGDCCPDKVSVCDQQPASCEGACGGQSPAGCWCDETCTQYGDCCSDKADQCATEPPTGECTSETDCSAGQFCKLKDGDCKLLTLMIVKGTCSDKPNACYYLYAPVCGCDGKTYGNDCEAAAAGVSVASTGECQTTPPPPPSECFNDQQCGDEQFCKLSTGDCKSMTTDIKYGACTDKPTACYEIYAPVCGCDGKTYGNDCEAAAAGTSIASQGECE